MKIHEAINEVEKQYPGSPLKALEALARKHQSGAQLTEAERIFVQIMSIMFEDEMLRDHHKHRCPRCLVIWEHDRPPPTASDEDYERAHMCPRGCGIDVRDKYHAEEVRQ